MARTLVSLVIVALVLVPATAAAQIETGSLLVKIVDPQDAAMPGVTVTLSSTVLPKPLVGVTDSGGIYRFQALTPGTYTVTSTLSGFATMVREGVIVRQNQTLPVDFKMQVAGLSETVTVRSESPVVDTTNASLNVNLDAKLLETTPGGKDIWSILEYKIPGLVFETPDVGGNQAGLQRGFSSRGTGSAQNAQYLNGVNVGDPSALGASGFYYDTSAFENVQVTSGATDISVPNGGVFINMVTKSGTNRVSGTTTTSYQGRNTQSKNIDEFLLQRGFRPTGNVTQRLTNINQQFGGPIIRNQLFYQLSFNDQRIHVNVPGFPAFISVPPQYANLPGLQQFPATLETTDITSGGVDMTYQPFGTHRIRGYFTYEKYWKPNRGASGTTTPNTTSLEDDHFTITQLQHSAMFRGYFVDSKLSYNDIYFPLGQKTDMQPLLDLTTNIQLRNRTSSVLMERHRLQLTSNVNAPVWNFLRARHEIRMGMDHAYTPETVTTTRVSDVELRFRSLPSGNTPAGASEVRFFNTPLHVDRASLRTAVYAQDTVVLRRLTLIAGIRWERIEGFVPEQHNPPSTYFPEGKTFTFTRAGQPVTYTVTRDYSETRNIPLYKNVAPRFSLTYDVPMARRTAIKFSLGRYFDQVGMPGGGLNPNVSLQENYQWLDHNGDLIYQDGERGNLLSRTNPAAPAVTNADCGALLAANAENLPVNCQRRPYRNEIVLGVDHELFKGVRLSVSGIYRRERDQLGDIEINVPFSSYTLVNLPEPGRDGVFGTSDDGVVGVYAEDPATVDDHVEVERNDDRFGTAYKGLEITITKLYSRGWTFLAGYTFARQTEPIASLTDPNDALVNADGPTGGRGHLFKATGSYLLPWWDITIGANIKWEQGRFITRSFTFPGLPQGNVSVRVEPRGGDTTDALFLSDLRVGKILRVGGQSLEVSLDVYNLMNANTVYSVRTGTGITNLRYAGDTVNGAQIEVPTYGSPSNFLPPRIARVNLVWKFGGGATPSRER